LILWRAALGQYPLYSWGAEQTDSQFFTLSPSAAFVSTSDTLKARVSEILTKEVKGWRGKSDFQMVPMAGGFTNSSYFVSDGRGMDLVVRVSEKSTNLLGIERANERYNAKVAAILGISPKIYYFSEGDGISITQFLQAKPITPEQLKEPDILLQVADHFRRIHAGPSFKGLYSPFQVIWTYKERLEERGFLFNSKHSEALKRLAQIENVLKKYEYSAPIHADAWYPNILLDKDRKIHVIDWEYSGMGDPYFDLNEIIRPTEVDSKSFLTLYLQREPTSEELAHLELMKVTGHLRDAFWNLLQGYLSKLDFDFTQIGNQFLDTFLNQAQGEEYEKWIALLQN